MQKHRLFLAVPIPERISDELLKIQKQLKKENFPGRFIPLENIHITLMFFGYLTDKEMEKLTEVLNKTISFFSKCQATITSFEFFPRKINVRVVALKVESEELKQMQQILQNELKKLKFIKDEKREYKPHLTIVRTKPKDIKPNLPEKLEKMKIPKIAWEINTFALMQSQLGPQGAKYKIVQKWLLKTT